MIENESNQVRPLIYDLDYKSIQNLMASLEEPSYRAKQVWQGLYKNLWGDFIQFSNLPNQTRSQIAQATTPTGLSPTAEYLSKDKHTIKTAFQLRDGRLIETVLMRYRKRNSLCISTQAGCAMGCVFCATGQMGYGRNLTAGEIIEQVLFHARKLKEEGAKLTNVVIMGMGEPFHNYNATLAAINRLNDQDGFRMGERRFTISTVGLIPEIKRFTEESRQINLAISLHAADDTLRKQLIPISSKYPLKELMQACHNYVMVTNRRITFEWALIKGVNDTPQQAEKLANLIEGMLCHVNLIPLNSTHAYDQKGSTAETAHQFSQILEHRHITATTRLRRGIDILAGCGQLASQPLGKE
jgi:23S rRNA (adenine2503-C2)-methyltransferase